MATSSITHDFILETDEQVLRFINAIEESRKHPYVPKHVAYKELKGEKELIEFMRKRKRILEEKKNAENQ